MLAAKNGPVCELLTYIYIPVKEKLIKQTLIFLSSGYAFNFPTQGVKDFVKISAVSHRFTELTVCLWMSSSITEGSLFSYAVSGRDNEILIAFDKKFYLRIGGQKRLCT